MSRLEEIQNAVQLELARAVTKHPKKFNSPHEGFAVIHEELDELWEAVRADDIAHALKEAEQVAATAMRFILDLTPQ